MKTSLKDSIVPKMGFTDVIIVFGVIAFLIIMWFCGLMVTALWDNGDYSKIKSNTEQVEKEQKVIDWEHKR